MNDTERYLFDLQGYLVLKGVVPAAILRACNAALDRFEHLSEDEYPPPLCLGQERSEQNLYISNIIEGEDVFLDLMDIPTVLDAVETVTGGPYRLNHTYTIIFTEALTHGSMVNTSGRPRRTLYFCYSIGYMPDWGGQGLEFSDGFASRLSESRQTLLRLK